MVYEELLVCSRPLTTNDCAEPAPSEQTLDSKILGTNRQIHDEAAAVLYGKNTFCVGPRQGGGEEITTIAPRYRHLLRSLRVEVLYCAGKAAIPEEEERNCSVVDSSKESGEAQCRQQNRDAEAYGMLYSPLPPLSPEVIQRNIAANALP